LKAAGVSAEILKLIPSICDTCSICRQWHRPGPKTMVSSRLSEHFNENVQCDLLFIESYIIVHLLDESLRWTATALVADKSAETLTRAITRTWIKMYGPMTSLISDQEGGLASEVGAIWAERHRINLRLKAKYQHAGTVERHHEILRQVIHRMLSQCRSENLLVDFEDVLAEATFVKNAMVVVGGTTPYVGLFGRFPRILAEFENQTISGASDHDGVNATASQHVARLRELAILAITEATAQSRLKLAERSRTATAAEAHDFRLGELVDMLPFNPKE